MSEQLRVTVHKQKLLEALAANLFNISDACRQVGVEINTHYRYYYNDPEYREKCREILDIQIDFVEGELFKKIKAGDSRCIMFYLRTKGKSRGYGEKIEVTENVAPEPVKVIFLNGNQGD